MLTLAEKNKIILEGENLTVSYGPVEAIKAVSFYVGQNEIVAMVGPNGAGKSTTLKAITGLLDQTSGRLIEGEILLNGESIKYLRTDELVQKGVAFVPEGRRVFYTMTVLENLELGAYITKDDNRVIISERIKELLELFPALKDKQRQKAGTLSTGEQQLLAIARALMIKPKLLLLDEPSLGLSPNYIETVFNSLVEINKGGVSILLVEQNAHLALEICSRGYVFELGSISIQGEKEKLLENQIIKNIYLGG